MNNFFKYPSGSDIDVAEMFTKDNLVSITGLCSANVGFDELAVLNNDNNFKNIDSPTEIPEWFEIKFKDIAITVTNNSESAGIIINRNIWIMITRTTNKLGKYVYNFNLGTIENWEEDHETIAWYYIN